MIISLFTMIFVAAGFVLLALSIFLFLEVVASLAGRSPLETPVGARGRIAVVIPAHNEQEIVAATVAAVRAQLRDIDSILVVADNCDDATADKARPAGAVAIERRDASRCGKGYALQYGVDHLRSSPPETVVFMDADCRPDPGAIPRLAALAAFNQRPVQALYLMDAPAGAGPKSRVSAFAWLLMNRVRMSGLQEIASVTRLTGSGMAFPWGLISATDLGGGEIVEDLALTTRMTAAGSPPLLDLGSVVRSELARSAAGETTQRARWEIGSLRMAVKATPQLIMNGLKGDMRSLALAFDIATPPLTVFAAVLVAAFVIGVVLAFLGAPAVFQMAIWSLALFGGAVSIGWFRYGQEILPASELKAVAAYIAGKARVYGGEGRKSARSWTRTDRGPE